MTTIRVLLEIAAIHNWSLLQLYVNTSFLRGDINKEVYMRLHQALHYLNQILYAKWKDHSMVWNRQVGNATLSSLILSSLEVTLSPRSIIPFSQKKSPKCFIVILVYVYDLVLWGTELHEIQQLKALLDAKFSIKDLGILKYLLGFEVYRNAHGISLCQRKYVLDLIHDACLLGAKPCTIPMQPHLQLQKQSETPISEPTTYWRLIGLLLYLTYSRPEVVYVVSKLSRFLDAPTDRHMLAGVHVLKYLINNLGQWLFFNSTSPLCLKGFSYSYWGACLDTHRSTSSICFFLGESLISWKRKK